jgi:hypothetical protein
MARFLATNSPMKGLPEVRRFSNTVSGEAAAFSSIQAIAAGIPRAFPFHNATIHFHAPVFGEFVPGVSAIGDALAGVTVSDSWWVNGRNRSLFAVTIVEADPGSKKLPTIPEPVAAVIAACGNTKGTVQVPLTPAEPQSQLSPASASPEAVAAVRRIVAEYRGRLKEIVERAAPPHDLPPIAELLRDSLWIASGSRRPALEQAFKPLGYTCRGESGTFSLRRKTQANLTAQLYLDVGTWSRHVTAIFQILGVGFKASMTIPVAVRALAIPDWRRRTLAEDR